MPIKRIIIAIMVIVAAIDATAAEMTDSVRLDEVVVTGVRGSGDTHSLPATVTVVDRNTLEQSHQTSILQVLNAEVPGFFATSRGVMGYGVSTGGSGQMSVRGIGGAAQSGLPTTALLVLIDGHPQYMGLMGHPIADAYQTTIAERVEVLRGPASTLYGSNAMGGVINIITRKEPVDTVERAFKLGVGSYGTVEAECSVNRRIGKFTGFAAVNYNRSDGHRANMGFEQAGGIAKFGYEFSNNWNATLDLNTTHFDASNPGAVGSLYYDNDQCIDRNSLSLVVNDVYGSTSGAVSLFINWGRHKINDGYQEGEDPLDYRFNSRDRMMGVSIYQGFSFLHGNRTTVGFDYLHFGGKAWNKYISDGSRDILVDKTMDEVAGYVDFNQRIDSWLAVDAGARIDHHSHTGTEFVPQAGVVVNLSDDTDIKASASRGYRNPTIREMYMFAPQNPDLEPESLWSYELSFSRVLQGGRLRYSAGGYYINGDNIIIRAANPNGSGMLNQNSGEIENWGAEASASWAINTHWSVSGSYSWLHMENPVLASPEHKLVLSARFVSGRWSACAGLQCIAGLYTDLDEDTTEDFVLLDAQCGYKATDRLSLYVKGENLLAQRYQIMDGYPMPKATFMAGLSAKF